MPITLLVMTITLLTGLWSIQRPTVMIKFMLHPFTIFKEHEYYRLITGDLMHNDLVHLAINEFLLFFICGKLEHFLRSHLRLGGLYYGIIYLMSMLTASISVSIINRRDFNYSGAGASGTILGCMMSYMILQPNVAGFYLPVFGEVNNMVSALIVIIGLTVYKIKTAHAYINHELHFFGAVGGVISTLALIYSL